MACRFQRGLVWIRAPHQRCPKLDQPFPQLPSSLSASHRIHQLHFHHHRSVHRSSNSSFPPISDTSSILSLGHIASPIVPVPEIPFTDPQIANLSGYSRSKWVAETLLLRAKQERDLCVNVVRVGQIAGDTKVGGWNEKEWVPVMLRGSQVLGATPERTEVRTFGFIFTRLNADM